MDESHESTKRRKTEVLRPDGNGHNRKLSDAGSRSTINENRKLAQASRTLKACDLCRKQKTRCFRSPDNPNSCLRCTFLNKGCSFEATKDHMSTIQEGNAGTEIISTQKKLDMIYGGISEVLKLLKHGDSTTQPMHRDTNLLLEAASALRAGDGAFDIHEIDSEHHGGEQAAEFEEHSSFQSPTNSLKASPFAIVTNEIAKEYIPPSILNLLNLSTVRQRPRISEDIITLNILSEAETIDLISDFRRNYGRWVSFPKNVKSKELVNRIRLKSPLLLTTCSCLSLRYTLNGLNPGDISNFKRKKRTYRELCKQLVKEINKSLLKFTSFKGDQRNEGDIEFLQSLVILSIYSLSLTSVINGAGERINGDTNTTRNPQEQIDEDEDDDDDDENDLTDLSLDPWFLSSVGLSTFLTKSTFGSLFPNTDEGRNGQEMVKSNSTGQVTNSLLDAGASPSFLDTPNFLKSTPPPIHLTESASLSTLQTNPSILFNQSDSAEYQTLTILRIYNHLCLVHIINCVFSGRMCIIDEIRLNYCTSTLSLSSSTNFDGRMISEIGILLITYNYVQLNLNNGGGDGRYISAGDCERNFLSVQEEVKSWYDQWEYLINQSTLQFVETNYNFCTLIIYYSYNYQKSLLVKTNQNLEQLELKSSLYDESNIDFILRYCDKASLVKMIEHASNVVKFVNVIESDSYFAFLSDQIHFCFYFSGICLIKLLKFVVETKQETLFSEITYNDIEVEQDLRTPLKDLRSLISKFKSVGQGNVSDIITKYENGLRSCLSTLEEVL